MRASALNLKTSRFMIPLAAACDIDGFFLIGFIGGEGCGGKCRFGRRWFCAGTRGDDECLRLRCVGRVYEAPKMQH